MRLIDADALGIGKCNSDTFPLNRLHYCQGWNAVIDIINAAPTVPAVPLADHERVKREMHSEIASLKKQLAELKAKKSTQNYHDIILNDFMKGVE